MSPTPTTRAARDLLYAALTVRDQTFRYYRFQTPDDNAVDYYDESGRSTRKFLLRKPIANGELTSGFGMRYHPILHFTRMHTGVDWAAPIGTPILAAGNGVVIKAEWDSGYGRRVEIQHANGYVTTYNHMSGFGRGITEEPTSPRARSSAISARPASPPARTCTTRSSSTATSSTRWRSSSPARASSTARCSRLSSASATGSTN